MGSRADNAEAFIRETDAEPGFYGFTTRERMKAWLVNFQRAIMTQTLREKSTEFPQLASDFSVWHTTRGVARGMRATGRFGGRLVERGLSALVGAGRKSQKKLDKPSRRGRRTTLRDGELRIVIDDGFERRQPSGRRKSQKQAPPQEPIITERPLRDGFGDYFEWEAEKIRRMGFGD